MVIADAHVHLHACFSLSGFLDAARTNFERVARQQYDGDRVTGVLCLTEGRGENGFERLLARAEEPGEIPAAGGRWRVHRTEEAVSLRLMTDERNPLFVIAGQQVATREGLEVLALGTRASFDDGGSIEDTIRAAARADALPVVPWGFGKWIGSRGQQVEQLLRDDRLPRLFVGDNANRPVFLGRSNLFDVAAERGIIDVPGSDPLPFPRMISRVGQAGFVLEEPLDSGAPAGDLKERLAARRRPLDTFMQCERPLRFVRNQLAMQYRKFVRDN